MSHMKATFNTHYVKIE